MVSLRQSRTTSPLHPAHQVRLHSSGHPFTPGGRASSCSSSRLACPPRQNLVPCHYLSNVSSTSIESHPAPRESFIWLLMKPEPLRSAEAASPPESGSIAWQWSAKSRRIGSISIVGDKLIQLDRDEVVSLWHRAESERRKQQVPPLCAVASR